MDSTTEHFARHGGHADPGNDIDHAAQQFSAAARRARYSAQRNRTQRNRSGAPARGAQRGRRAATGTEREAARRAKQIATTWPVADLAARWAATRTLAEESEQQLADLRERRQRGGEVPEAKMRAAERIADIRRAHAEAWDELARDAGFDTTAAAGDVPAGEREQIRDSDRDSLDTAQYRDRAADRDTGYAQGWADRDAQAGAETDRAFAQGRTAEARDNANEAVDRSAESVISPVDGPAGIAVLAASEAAAEELTDHYLDTDPFAAQAPPGRPSINDLIAQSDLATDTGAETSLGQQALHGLGTDLHVVAAAERGTGLDRDGGLDR